MAKADETHAARQQIEELMAALGQKLSTFSPEVIYRLHEKKDAFVQEVGNRAEKLGEPQIVHADICIERVIGGRKFRFRGFIRDDDAKGYVLGETMIERVRATGDTPTGKADNEHLVAHLDEWKKDPELADYYVVTNERRPGDSRVVRCFDRGIRERFWRSLDNVFLRGDLVACRAA